MALRSYLLQLLRDVRSQKLRTFLTLFGLIWGTASVTLLLAFGQGLHGHLIKQMKGLGENIIICWPSRTSLPWQGLPKGRRVRVNEDLADLVTDRMVRLEGILDTETLIAFRAYARRDLDAGFALGAEG